MNGARARVIRIRVRVHVRAMHWGRSGVGVEIYIEQGLDGVRASSA